MLMHILLRQPAKDWIEAYGPFPSRQAAMDAATRRWGNDPNVVLLPLIGTLSHTLKLPEVEYD